MRIALVQMPYATTSLPSLGLSLLQACLERRGHAADIFHFNLLFAGIVGHDKYESIATNGMPQQDLLGEWTFSEAVWGADPARDLRYYNEIMLGGAGAHHKICRVSHIDETWEKAQSCRDRVGAFLTACQEAADWTSYQLVGFTSMFEQTLASVAFAKILRKNCSAQKITFGGANCEGPMGVALLGAFSEIDAVCIGEGENAFPDYIDAIAAGGPITAPPGMRLRHDTTAGADDAPAGIADIIVADRTNLDDLPTPSYDAFFDQFQAHLGPVSSNVRITFESSRGCWWGQKNHCTFCGLNGTGMSFRSKSAARALSEIDELKSRYSAFTPKFSAADNIIPHTYFRDFLPELAKRDDKLDIFYETKANLRKDQVSLYRKAGLKFIQPGIESLDSGILKLMRKGVSALQNIQLLKWCREFNVKPLWNLLYGFPGEDTAAYARQAKLVALLRHLPPPNGSGSIRFDRFSPYHSHPENYGISELTPYPSYALVYAGLTQEQLAGLAYFFHGDYPNRDAVHSYTAGLRSGIEDWIASASQTALFHVENADCTVIFDLRDPLSADVVVLKGEARRIYGQCAAIATHDELLRSSSGIDECDLDAHLDRLKAHSLIIEEERRFLGLSLSLASGYRPPQKAAERLRQALGKADAGANGIEIPPGLIKATIGGNPVREESRRLGRFEQLEVELG